MLRTRRAVALASSLERRTLIAPIWRSGSASERLPILLTDSHPAEDRIVGLSVKVCSSSRRDFGRGRRATRSDSRSADITLIQLRYTLYHFRDILTEMTESHSVQIRCGARELVDRGVHHQNPASRHHSQMVPLRASATPGETAGIFHLVEGSLPCHLFSCSARIWSC